MEKGTLTDQQIGITYSTQVDQMSLTSCDMPQFDGTADPSSLASILSNCAIINNQIVTPVVVRTFGAEAHQFEEVSEHISDAVASEDK